MPHHTLVNMIHRLSISLTIQKAAILCPTVLDANSLKLAVVLDKTLIMIHYAHTHRTSGICYAFIYILMHIH